MDPTQTLSELLQACIALATQDATAHNLRSGKALDILDSSRDDCRDEAIEACNNLAGWIQKGGFAPDVAEAVNRACVEDNLDRLQENDLSADDRGI